MLGSLDGALKIIHDYNDITKDRDTMNEKRTYLRESDLNHPQSIQVTKNETSLSMYQFSQLTHLVLPLALSALQPEHQLLGGLGLLPQDGLGLASEALLLTVVPGEQ